MSVAPTGKHQGGYAYPEEILTESLKTTINSNVLMCIVSKKIPAVSYMHIGISVVAKAVQYSFLERIKRETLRERQIDIAFRISMLLEATIPLRLAYGLCSGDDIGLELYALLTPIYLFRTYARFLEHQEYKEQCRNS